jgi:hypothetical protein
MNHLSPTTYVIGAGVLWVLWLLWRGRRTARAAREVTRTGGSVGRAVMLAGLITGVQWAVVTYATSATTVLLTLGIPALFSGFALAQLMPVTTVHNGHKRGGAR